MCLDHRVSDSGGPLDSAYREDRQTPVARNVAQAICEVPFTLAAQTRDPVGRNIPQDSGRHCQCLQKFQSVQEPGCPRRVVAHLELAHPDEPADLAIDDFGQKCVQSFFRLIIKPGGNPGFYSSLRRDKRVGAQTLDDRDAWQDRLRSAAFFDKTVRQVVVGPGRFGLFLKPSLEIPCALAR